MSMWYHPGLEIKNSPWVFPDHIHFLSIICTIIIFLLCLVLLLYSEASWNISCLGLPDLDIMYKELHYCIHLWLASFAQSYISKIFILFICIVVFIHFCCHIYSII